MLKKGFPEDKVSSKSVAIIASLLLHVLGLLSLFIVLPSWNKPKEPPFVNVHLVHLQQKKTTTKSSVPVTYHSPPINQKLTPSTTEAAAPPKNKKVALNSKDIAIKKTNEVLLKKQHELKIKREKALQEKQQREKAERIAAQKEADQLQQFAAKQLAALQAKEQAKQREEITKNQRIMAHYTAVLREKISYHWHYPLNAEKNMRAVVRVTLTPMGEVINLDLVSSSGNKQFDQSVINAIRASSPFDSLSNLNIRLFEANFRTLTLGFTPQDLME